MTIPKEAIEKAIEAGWDNSTPQFSDCRDFCSAALDPSFWQALGKSCGWEEHANVHSREKILGSYGSRARLEAHRFYDLILIGGDTTKFWEELGLIEKAK